MSVQFTDNSVEVKSALEEAVKAFLHEASGELVTQIQRNTPVDTGQLKNSWRYKVDMGKKESTIGSPLENAIWTEFGTGEHALQGNGRKGGWAYKDAKGEWHYTRGKKPKRSMYTAFKSMKPKIIKRAEQVIGAKMK